MSEPSESFAELLDRARGGDEAAIARVVGRYENIIRRAARGRLGPALRPTLDSMDIVQSVHKSLLLGLRFNKFDIGSPEQLVALAMRIVQRKVARQWRRASRRPPPGIGDAEVLDALPDRTDDPTTKVGGNERVRQLLADLEPTDRQLVELRLAGHSTAEVARRLGVDAAMLRVRLARLRKRLRDSGLLDDWL